MGSNYKKIVVDGFASKQGLLCKPPQMINFRSRSKPVDNATLIRYPAATRWSARRELEIMNDEPPKAAV
ncbi:MAG: hypothetical protein LBO04_03805 [Spirochaetaceae bacterium]|nr:hypothetical protein [Spirochaetaceae bacterium]